MPISSVFNDSSARLSYDQFIEANIAMGQAVFTTGDNTTVHVPFVGNDRQLTAEQRQILKRQAEEYAKLKALQQKAKKKDEQLWLDEFIDTGVPKCLSAYTNKRGHLAVRSPNSIDSTNMLFYVIGKQLLLSKPRTTHLMARFKRLAEREALDIEFVSADPQIITRIPVAFWKWKELGVIDDTKLVTMAQPYLDAPQDNEHDYDGCSPDCEICHEDVDPDDFDRMWS